MAKKLVETTHYSLSTSAPARPERRQNDRHVTLLRVGALVVEGRRELCLIRNVSGGGMMIRPYSTLKQGARLSVELKHGESVSGVAQWAADGLVGIAFDQPIDMLALLTPSGDAPRPRMPRIDLNCAALLRHGGEVLRVQVVNISQGGICLSRIGALYENDDVVVSLRGLHSAAGVVKWQEGDQCGIGFNRVYPVHELMSFLKEQQRDEGQPQRAVA